MPLELYAYEKDDGTVLTGLTLEQANREEEKERLEREQREMDAKLGPQISAGIHNYEARKLQGQGQPVQSQPAMSSPAPAMSIQSMSGDGNINPVPQQSQFDTSSTPAFDSLVSNPNSISSMSNSFRSPPSAQEQRASADFMALTEGIPDEFKRDLIARYRMGELKPSAFVKEVLAIKKNLNDAKVEKDKAQYLSDNRIKEMQAEQPYLDTRQINQIESQQKMNDQDNANAYRIAELNASTREDNNKNKEDNDIFNQEYKLRTQYNMLSKDFRTTKDAFSKIDTSSKLKNASGDMALIYGFMRLQDPTSTVREGEYATAEQARGVPESVLNLYNKTVKGTKLSDRQREEFVNTARSQYQIMERNQLQLDQQYRDIALMYKLDPERVMGGTVQPGKDSSGNGSTGNVIKSKSGNVYNLD